MKRFAMMFALALLLPLAACGPGTKVGDVIAAATSTVTNPVSAVDVYRVKNTYAAALELMNQYRVYCWSKPYAALMADAVARPVCQSRRSVVRAMQSAQPRAGNAVRAAEAFVRDNPTLNAATALTAAWDAVQAFQKTVPTAN